MIFGIPKILRYGPPRFQSPKEWHCLKCGEEMIQTRYNKKKDIMEIYCNDCDYEYTAPALDKLRSESGKQV